LKIWDSSVRGFMCFKPIPKFTKETPCIRKVDRNHPRRGRSLTCPQSGFRDCCETAWDLPDVVHGFETDDDHYPGIAIPNHVHGNTSS
jgi:hypothetical protein